jgi:hypothetical protein
MKVMFQLEIRGRTKARFSTSLASVSSLKPVETCLLRVSRNLTSILSWNSTTWFVKMQNSDDATLISLDTDHL